MWRSLRTPQWAPNEGSLHKVGPKSGSALVDLIRKVGQNLVEPTQSFSFLQVGPM